MVHLSNILTMSINLPKLSLLEQQCDDIIRYTCTFMEDSDIIKLYGISHRFKNVKIYVPYNSEIEKVAIEHSIEIIYEAFADRNYNEDLTLVSRSKENAIIIDSTKVTKHVSNIISGKVKTVSGKEIVIKANTFCVHGDNKNVLEILYELNQNFNRV